MFDVEGIPFRCKEYTYYGPKFGKCVEPARPETGGRWLGQGIRQLREWKFAFVRQKGDSCHRR